MKISICLIATGNYTVFVQPLIDSIKQYMLLNHTIEINLFTDNIDKVYVGSTRVPILKHEIPSYKFPYATLYRYNIITSIDYKCDYLYYLDVDYLIVSPIDEEFLGDIVAVHHPGYYISKKGSWGTDKLSTSYTFSKFRENYYCGGTQGGRYEYYYNMCQRLARDIKDDEDRGVMAEWHDETHFNRFLSEYKDFKALTPEYCSPEEPYLRELWGISNLTPKILALAKDHDKLRK